MPAEKFTVVLFVAPLVALVLFGCQRPSPVVTVQAIADRPSTGLPMKPEPLKAATGARDIASADSLERSATPEKPTVRSEISRGENATFECTTRTGIDLYAFFECVGAVLDDNIQKQSVTDAFRLGLDFGAWRKANTVVNVVGDPGNNIYLQMNTKLAREMEEAYVKELSELQKTLNVSEEQLCQAAKKDCPTVLPNLRSSKFRFLKPTTSMPVDNKAESEPDNVEKNQGPAKSSQVRSN